MIGASSRYVSVLNVIAHAAQVAVTKNDKFTEMV